MAIAVGTIEQFIEKIAPKSWAETWDNPGLLVGKSSQRAKRILLALDGTESAVRLALAQKAELIIAHHPLLLEPLHNLRGDNAAAQVPLLLHSHGIAYLAAHTNLDQSALSSSLFFARALELREADYLAESGAETLYKLIVYVPTANAETLRTALVAAGVGAWSPQSSEAAHYAECFYQGEGEGMFKPLAGAMPAVGKVGKLTRVRETRLESIVCAQNLAAALKALVKAHPYEEPAYDIIPLLNKGKRRGYGQKGLLPEPLSPVQVAEKLRSALEEIGLAVPQLILSGALQKPVSKVAIANGSGKSFVNTALHGGAELFVTGEIDYHLRLTVAERGLAVLELGHFLSEVPMLHALRNYLCAQKGMDAEIILSTEGVVF